MEPRGDGRLAVDGRRRLLAKEAEPRGLLRVRSVIRADSDGDLAHRFSGIRCRRDGYTGFGLGGLEARHRDDLIIAVAGGGKIGGRGFWHAGSRVS